MSTDGPSSARRLLVIDARIVTPMRDSGSLRMFNLLQIFGDVGFDVSFVPSFIGSFTPFDDSLEEDTARLQRAGVRLPADNRSVDEYLRQRYHEAI